MLWYVMLHVYDYFMWINYPESLYFDNMYIITVILYKFNL